MPKKDLKRFLVFAGDTHYPMGGWRDLKGSSDVFEETIKMAEGYDWAEVIDSATGDTMWSTAGGYDTGYYKWAEGLQGPNVTLVPTAAITIVNEDVLASARLHVQSLLDRGRYKSRKEWAKAVMEESADDPVDLYRQKDGSLSLLDGNHRYLAATILGVDLPVIIHG